MNIPIIRSAFDLREERNEQHPSSTFEVASMWMFWVDEHRFDELRDVLSIRVDWSEFPRPRHDFDLGAVKVLVCRWLREHGYIAKSTFKHLSISLPVVYSDD